MNVVVIANMISMIGCVLMVGVGFLQKKNQILLVQCVQFAFLAAANLLLGAMTGFISGGISIVRNLIFTRRENTGLLKVVFTRSSILPIFTLYDTTWVPLFCIEAKALSESAWPSEYEQFTISGI
ncbi:MAG: YgjV family protein, partial [Oscillospiraceae bacterium]|nr:YgjV family protein [Oscillospiraceae bacterium]